MKKTIEVSAKKVEDAIAEGLAILGVTIDEAEVKIISTGGLFKKAKIEISTGQDDPAPQGAAESVSAKPSVKLVTETAQPEKPAKPEGKADKKLEKAEKAAKRESKSETKAEVKAEIKAEKTSKPEVKPETFKRERFDKKNREPRESAPATPETIAAAEGFLSKTLQLAGIEATLNSEAENGLSINIVTEESAVIGHRGETLDALQYLTNLVVNESRKSFTKISLDAFGYRGRRAESLKRMAEKMADKCVRQNRRVALEPMNNSDRKEIHAFLSENSMVVTRSEGAEPNRRIVIYPAKK
ncbi:MAG: KH domain-containing protein [Firmicutes bacterium]|nr:KH domain-containing protein [Bacillota bacterium]